MIEFARHEFRLGKRGKDGVSLRETLEVVERMTGRMPDEGINPVDFPEVARNVWVWFLKLNHKRPPAMAGVSPIPEAEIGWFFRNRGISPAGWELDAIAALDMVARDSVGKDD